MGKLTSDFERFLYSNYPDEYMRATAEDASDDVITAILSRHHFHYEVWKDIPEWIRAEYRDDIPQEVLNGNTRVEDFVDDEYEKLTPEGQEKAKEQEEREEREAMFVANLTVALLAAGYSAEAVGRLAENHGERSSILKQMEIHGRTPEMVAAYRATRESDKKVINAEYNGNKRLIHKKVMHLAKDLNRMKRSRYGYDEKEYKEKEEKLKQAMAFVAADPEARRRVEEHLNDPVARSALRHLVPEVKDLFSTLMDNAGLLPVMQEAMQRGKFSKTKSADVNVISSDGKQSIEDSQQALLEKKVVRYAKIMSRMKNSKDGYDAKEYAALEEKFRESVAQIAGDEKQKKDLVEYLKQPVAQRSMDRLTDDVRNVFISSMKDIGIVVTRNDETAKGFDISRDTLVESLKKDFAEREKLEKILANKFGNKVVNFVRAKVQDVVSTIPNDKIDKLVMINKRNEASRT